MYPHTRIPVTPLDTAYVENDTVFVCFDNMPPAREAGHLNCVVPPNTRHTLTILSSGNGFEIPVNVLVRDCALCEGSKMVDGVTCSLCATDAAPKKCSHSENGELRDGLPEHKAA